MAASLNDKLANKVYSIFSLHTSMERNYDKAIAAITAPDAWVDSFKIEDLTTVAAERKVWGYLHVAVEDLTPLVEMKDGRFADIITGNRGEIIIIMDRLENITRESVLRFYLPNSTSNIDVEMKLREHSAWLDLYKTLIGEL